MSYVVQSPQPVGVWGLVIPAAVSLYGIIQGKKSSTSAKKAAQAQERAAIEARKTEMEKSKRMYLMAGVGGIAIVAAYFMLGRR